MVTEDSSLRPDRSSMIGGSGLSGMVAAFISAKSLEQSPSHDDGWQARYAFRSFFPGKRFRRRAHGGSGVEIASQSTTAPAKEGPHGSH